MRLKHSAVLVLALCLMGVLSAGEKTQTVKIADKSFKFDGKLLEDCWKSQTPEKDFSSDTGAKLPLETEVMVARDDSAIYFAAKCAIPEKERFRAMAVPRDRGIGMGLDDCMIFTLFPGSERDAYYAFYVNGRGAVWTQYRSQGGWVSSYVYLSDVRARAYRDEKNKVWTCELMVPFANLSYSYVPGKVWGWNAARLPRFVKGTYSLLDGKLFLPDARKDISGFDLDFSDFMLEVSNPEIISQINKKHKISINVTNRSGKQAAFRLQAAFLPTQKNSMGADVTLAPAETKNVVLTPKYAVADGNCQLRLVLRASKKRKILRTNTVDLTINYTPWKCTLLKPQYRNTLFDSNPDKQIQVKVDMLLTGKTVAQLKDAQGKELAVQSVDNSGVITFDAAKLPFGNYNIVLTGPVIDGKKSEEIIPIKKLAPKKGEVWRDDEGFLRKDGKRIFVISEWNDVPLKETNAIQMWHGIKELKGRMGISFRLSSSRFRKTYLWNTERFSDKAKEEAAAIIKRQSQIEPLIIWQMSDEPESQGNGVKKAVFEDMYKFFAEQDPYHPVSIGSFTVRGMRSYAECYDINFLHPYPDPILNTPRSCFSKVVEFMDSWEAFQKERGSRAPVMLYLLQGFNYGDLIGNQRVPSYDELRTQTMMSLISGGQGIMFYNRSAKYYPELAWGTPAIARELRILEPVMVESNIKDPAMKCPVRPFRWIVKKHKGHLWIFAGSFDEKKINAQMTIPELGNRKLHVFGEKRSLQVANGRFSDTFNNFDTHVYTTDETMANAIDFAAVESEIEKCYAQRRKPGNLAYQRNEDEKLRVTSSSSIYYRARRSRYSALWHVTDGAFEKGERMYFEAAAPGTGKEYLELKFNKPIEANQVVIYPLNNSLCDYTVEVMSDGKWLCVADVKNGSGDVRTHDFARVKTDTIRINASKSRSAMSIIEIEVYNK